MNIHPAFVHFPIALLFVYALLELLPLASWWPSFAWGSVKRFALYLGTPAAIATAVTGGMAEDAIGEIPSVEVHEKAALLLIALSVLASALTFWWKAETPARAWIVRIVALAILIMLFVVGSLGANIVYGSNVDPIVTLVVKLLGAQ